MTIRADNSDGQPEGSLPQQSLPAEPVPVREVPAPLSPAADLSSPDTAAESLTSQPQADAREAIPIADILCWRCGKTTPAGPTCTWCRARLMSESIEQPVSTTRDDSKRLLRLIASYAGLLIGAAIFGIVAYVLADETTGHARRRSLYSYSIGEAILEGVWTIIVLLAVWTSPRPPSLDPFGWRTRRLGWMLALPILVVCLAVNFVYHFLLIQYAGRGSLEIDVSQASRPSLPDMAFAVVTVCILPGVIEELFFRYQALGTLRSVMGRHSAVIVSSIMFGVAHVHVPFSIPVLIVVGLGLGYVRLLSGSLVLPMLLHALHNGVVLWRELAT